MTFQFPGLGQDVNEAISLIWSIEKSCKPFFFFKYRKLIRFYSYYCKLQAKKLQEDKDYLRFELEYMGFYPVSCTQVGVMVGVAGEGQGWAWVSESEQVEILGVRGFLLSCEGAAISSHGTLSQKKTFVVMSACFGTKGHCRSCAKFQALLACVRICDM